MKKMTKRTLALAMSTGMLLSNSVWAADTDADPYGAMPETVTLHVGRSEDANASYLSGQDSLNNYLVDYIKEQLNVDFVYDFSVASDYSTKVSMAIASGSIPDIMFVTASQLRELVAADAVEDMTAVYETYASDNLKAAYDTTDGISFKNATFDGKLMAMPSISPGADAIPILFVRGDWMDELGLDEPKTVEDITNIVKAFKEKYGDSNSLVMSQNIVSENGNNTYGMDALFALYGAYPKHWVTDADGNLVYGSNTDEAKTALATVTLFSIVGHWNNFFDGLLLINNPDKVPLQTYIQSLVVKLSEASNMSSSELIQVMSQRTFNAAKIVASTIPILVIYPFMQKYFVTGLTLGSVKE